MSVASPSSGQHSGIPLGIGQIIADAFAVSLRNYGWVLLLNPGSYVAFAGFFGSLFWSNLTGATIAAGFDLEGNAWLLYLLLLLASLLCLALLCATIRLLHDRNADPRLPVIATCIAGARRLLPALGLLVIYVLAYFVLYFAAALFGLMLAASGMPLITIMPVFLATACFLLYLVFPYLLSFVICINEGLGPIRALGRSRYLSDGYRWPLFGMVLLTSLIWLAYLVVIEFVERAFGPSAGLASLVLMLLSLPLVFAWMAGIYAIAAYRLRIIKDGVEVSASVASVFD